MRIKWLFRTGMRTPELESFLNNPKKVNGSQELDLECLWTYGDFS